MRNKKTLKIFLLIFLLLGTLFASLITVIYQLQIAKNNQQLRAGQEHVVDLQRAVAANYFNSLVSDLSFLAEQENLQLFLQDPSEKNRLALANEYRTFSKNKEIYDQIRLLDVTGQELVRVNYRTSVPKIVAKKRLQNKADRYYFAATFKLGQGEVYVSPLDLNVERGRVEIPYKPMIRFGTPVFDREGNKRGILVLNYLGQNFIDLLVDAAPANAGRAMLLNSEGYWLEHPNPVKEWGFMFAEKSDQSFARQWPEIWQKMLAEPSGQLQTEQGVYAYTTVWPVRTVTSEVAARNDFWKIVSFQPKESFTSYSKSLFFNLVALAMGLFFIAAIIAWLLAMAIARRKLYQSQLFSLAHYDKLTELPNRTLFFDRLRQTLELSKRHSRQCALLFVDLDRFKSVNDRFGHGAGDELLAAVAKRMKLCCRGSDTVARIGGDEFAILMTEVISVAGATTCSEKLLEELARTFELQKGKVQIGASIGIAMYPDHGANPEALLKSADAAMYLSKKRGKHGYTFAGEEDSDNGAKPLP